MNLIAVKIGRITDTLHGKLFSLLCGVPTCIPLKNLLREKQTRGLETYTNAANYDFKAVLLAVETHKVSVLASVRTLYSVRCGKRTDKTEV